MQDQQLGDFLRLDARVIFAPVDLVSRHRFQHGHPLVIVGLVRRRQAFQQLVVLDVDDARGHLGPLQRAPGLQEMPAFVVRQGVVGDAVKAMAGELDRVAETMRADGDFSSAPETRCTR